MDCPRFFDVPKRETRLNAGLVLQSCIGCDLLLGLLPCPILPRHHEFLPPTLPAQVFIHLPAFDITNRTALAAIGVVTLPQFDETAQTSLAALDDKGRVFRAGALFFHIGAPLVLNSRSPGPNPIHKYSKKDRSPEALQAFRKS